jgi:hypothetical protein
MKQCLDDRCLYATGAGLGAGQHLAELVIRSNDPDIAVTRLPLEMSIA